VLQIDPTCLYNNIISISKFEPKYHLCGGINLPKILLCVGSDGIKRRQLIKVIIILFLFSDSEKNAIKHALKNFARPKQLCDGSEYKAWSSPQSKLQLENKNPEINMCLSDV
jgi:hypothetical protein